MPTFDTQHSNSHAIALSLHSDNCLIRYGNQYGNGMA